MKTHHIITCLAILVIGNSCQEEEKPVYLERISLDNIPEYTLEIDTLHRFGSHLPPEVYLLNDSTLFLTYSFDAAQVSLFDINRKEMNNLIIKKQSERVKISDKSDVSGKVNLWHKTNRHYYEFIAENGELRIEEYTQPIKNEDYLPYMALKLDKTHFVGLGNYPKGLFALFDTKKREISFQGTFPVNEAKYYNKQYIHNFKGSIDSKDNEVVYVSEYFGYISLYELKKGKLKKRWEKQLTDFVFKTNSTRMTLGNSNMYGFDKVQMINDRIYGLYLGYSPSSSGILQNSLIVFDREGNPLARYYFPQMMSHFVIDREENYVYTSFNSYSEGNYLCRFRLPELD